MPKSPEELAHLEWLGYVQPVGLVVSIPALLEAQCYINKNVMGQHTRFLSCLTKPEKVNAFAQVTDLPSFLQNVLGWHAGDVQQVPKLGQLEDDLANLEVILPQYNETLRPTHVVLDLPKAKSTKQPASTSGPSISAASTGNLATSAASTGNPATATSREVILLIQELDSEADFDEPLQSDSAKHWHAAPHAKFERLLRESGVPIGLLFNHRQFRLVYAPRGETSGYATFNVDEMAQVAGRPMFAAFHMLLCADRLFSLADNQRLPYILANSRKYQNVVSTALAEQVTSALFELLRGFQAANDQRKGELLRNVLANNPQHVYHGLLTVLMRLVFVLYAEDRGLVSSDPIYSNYYSISGLFERLRSEAGRFPDTMDQRFGAWAQLLTLFRLIYEGGQHAELKIPARKGYLFDPDRYPFLEGRVEHGESTDLTHPSIPHISDGVIYRVLEDLLVLDGERLSYRTLDVEQIGSVYEAIMGFELQVSQGKSIAIKPVKSHGAPATINLEELLAAKPVDRAKMLSEWTDQKLSAGDSAALKEATSIDQIVAALEKKIAKHVTPGIVPAESMVFQPSDERRRSGSHYTPRSLTEPIVRTTLEPILKQLCDPDAELPKVYEPSKSDKQRFTQGERDARIRQSEKRIEYLKLAREKKVPHPNQILDLKVCDPAMGSGAFLVEACRQLGDHLIKAWYAHDMLPVDIPPDEDEVLYARRTVAQRCLYGVDKNIMAVDLAKLSLWLVTLAKDHPFTFLDHALRYGDSLVGLTREQIIGFHWEPEAQKKFGEELIQKQLDKATASRSKILNAREDVAYRDQQQQMRLADDALDLIRLVGNACVSCFFAADKKKAREEELERVFELASSYLSSRTMNKQQPIGELDFASRAAVEAAADRLKQGPHPVPCFHWEIEFPEVFSRENGGFDAFVGNPPFLGGFRVSNNLGMSYFDFLTTKFLEAGHLCDLSAYFFRNCFNSLRHSGVLGLVATNSIAQGDTRAGGLSFMCRNGGQIFSATRRLRWPGQAAVIVSVVHIAKGYVSPSSYLDGIRVKRISAYLFPRGGDDSPYRDKKLNPLFSQGTNIRSSGFLIGDGDEPTKPEEIDQILAAHPHCAGRVLPYLGGVEINSSPTHTPMRRVIYLSDIRDEAELIHWEPLADIVRKRVKPERDALGNNPNNIRLRREWWAYHADRREFYEEIRKRGRVLVGSQVSSHFAFAIQPSDRIYGNTLNLFLVPIFYGFAVMQSRIHEVWTRFLGSSMKDDLRYTPSDCFETFVFPFDVTKDTPSDKENQIDNLGEQYYALRSSLMIENNEGLTKTYNRFHDPNEKNPGISELRRLHGEMDVAVLRAYGWDDLADQAAQADFCQFLLDYVEDDDDSSSDSTSTRQKKKPWRYRWPDDFRDEVLARLLELNEQRHREEQLAGTANSTSTQTGKATSKTRPKRERTSQNQPLFDGEPDQ